MPANHNRFKVGVLVACGLSCAAPAFAQEIGESGTAAPHEKLPLVVVPIGLDTDRSLFVRTLSPTVPQSPLAPRPLRKGVIGDVAANSETPSWRFGSRVVRPTAPYDPLAAATWSAGVASVALAIEGVRMYDALPSERCSLAGEVDRGNANAFLVQPFVNYNLPDGWYLTSAPVISADWKAASGQKWTVPVGAGMGKLVRFGEMPLSMQLAYYYNIEKPDGAADWGLRLQLRLLFPG